MTVQEIQTMIRQNMVLYRNVAKPLTDKEADLLIATWADALSDVPSAAGKLAFRRALRVCHFPVLIADLYDQLRAMQMESEPKAADLWQLVCERAHKANENKGLYSFTGHLPDGRTQGQAARDANKRLFDELPPAVHEYFDSPSKNLCHITALSMVPQRSKASQHGAGLGAGYALLCRWKR